MLFPTATFAIFFLIVLPLSWLAMPRPHRWRPFIIAASYVFYAGGTGASSSCSRAHALEPRARRPHPPARRAVAAEGAALARARRATSACSATSSTTTSSSARRDNLLSVVGLEPAARRCGRSSAGRHLVLHVHGDQLRRRHLPRRLRAGRRSRSSRSTCRSSRTSSPGPIVRPGELIPQLETPRDPRRVDTSRAFYLIAHRPVQEGRDRELPRRRTSSTRCSARRGSTRRSRS